MSNWQLIESQIKSEIDPAYQLRSRLLLRDVYEKRPASVLDVGCGRGFYLRMLSQLPFIEQIVGLDSSAEHLGYARTAILDDRVSFIEGRADKLPFPSASFDFVLCSEVLEHLENDTDAARELVRVLKPGGTLGVSVPHEKFPFLWDPINWILMRLFNTHVSKNIHWLAGIWADHERLYSREELQRLLEAQGLSPSMKGVVRYCYPFSHFFYYGLGKNLVFKLNLKSFNRFSNNSNNFLNKLLAKLSAFPAVLFDDGYSNGTAVNLVAFASKKK